MPLPYNGQPSNVAFKPPVSITSVTAGTPITVQTGSAHNLVSGDWVRVSGTAVAQANGVFPVDVTSANTLTLRGSSAGSGSSVSGVLVPYAVQTYDTPADGEDATAASVFPSMAALGDRTALGIVNTGSLKLAIDFTRTGSQDSTNPLDYTTLWVAVTNPTHDLNWHNFTTLGPMPWTPEGTFVTGDLIDVDLDVSVSSNAATGLYSFSLWAVEFALGSVPPTGVGPGFGGSFIVPGAARQISVSVNSANPIHLSGRFTATSTGFVWVAVAINKDSSDSSTIGFSGDYMFRTRAWRATGITQ